MYGKGFRLSYFAAASDFFILVFVAILSLVLYCRQRFEHAYEPAPPVIQAKRRIASREGHGG